MKTTVFCRWDMCKSNNQGVCTRDAIRLELFMPDADMEGLVCASFTAKEAKKDG